MGRPLDFLARGTVALVDAARKMQGLQMRLTAREVKDGVEHFEPYGYTSNPLPGAEALLGFVGGDRSHCVALIVGDRRFRFVGLAPGEVAMYTDEGDSLVFRRGNRVELRTKNFDVDAQDRVTLKAGQEVVLDTPKVRATHDVEAAGQINDGVGSMQGMRDIFNVHDHDENDSGGPTNTPNQRME